MGDLYDQESIDDSDASSGRDAEEFDGHAEGHVDEDDAEDRDEVSEGNISEGEDALSDDSGPLSDDEDHGNRDRYDDEDEDEEDDYEDDATQSGGEGDAASAELEGADHGSEEAGDGGLPICPFEVEGEDGEFVVENLGAILFDLDGYHDADGIYPVGYSGTRALTSAANPADEADYVFEIRYGGAASGPVFVITDDQDEEFDGASPDQAWAKVVSKLRDAGWDGGCKLTGSAMFALTAARVREAIESLPGAQR
eukprot:CAMPEP_0172183766 /NCGR_PEP_ID=MMETSP1050-20130122/19180_1 /TAXON_ID=233186 /ORGANISM="Cryptomonas curvata, Strain CCAP979/52" /LENGTH=253 /DNA_ID=CAMNT_0012857445 /DNA_START=256 /DNA_END=1014 /DNA_ORIENTATION=+